MPGESTHSGYRLHTCRRIFGLPSLYSSAFRQIDRAAAVVLSSLEDAAVDEPAIRVLFGAGGEHVGQADDGRDKHEGSQNLNRQGHALSIP